MSPRETAKKIAIAMDAKKAADIAVLDINKLTTLGDYFVICTGASTTQIKAIADEIDKTLGEAGEKPLHVEGYSSASWILMDYGSVVAHIFHRDTRSFYGLERLWADAGYHTAEDFAKSTGDDDK